MMMESINYKHYINIYILIDKKVNDYCVDFSKKAKIIINI